VLGFILRRLLLALAVTVTLSAVCFVLLNVSGDLTLLLAGDQATEQDIAELRHQLGLDRPLYIQYFDWAIGVCRGDLGTSFFSKEAVSTMLARSLPITFKLGVSALCIALILALPLGILSAIRSNTWIHFVGHSVQHMDRSLLYFRGCFRTGNAHIFSRIHIDFSFRRQTSAFANFRIR
jgi:peptide/nickel transport system permease protein